ncbi:MAG TPA: hypothetical protein VJ142_00495 [Candidatus Nanoarchaeia archaeon]|nr:hypothetical protein [Candidatus Nanoarchaeia archaeon]
MSIKQFIKELNNDKVEGELIKTIFISIATSFILLAILYFLRLRYVENFIPKYGFYLFFAILSYSLILLSVRHIRAYREFPCMSGMMIGMTIGAISGFLPAFYIGSTNGMFIGSVSGMAIGIFFGVWNGKCCGVMGAMEGIMAGFMGGLMGAMTSLMMFNDNLRAAGIVVFLISGVILFGLNYMIYKETREIKMERKHKDDAFFTIFWSLLLTAITLWIMVAGPRSILFQ